MVEIVDKAALDRARQGPAHIAARLGVPKVAGPGVARIGDGAESLARAAIAKDREAAIVAAGACGRSRLREGAFGGPARRLAPQAARCRQAPH